MFYKPEIRERLIKRRLQIDKVSQVQAAQAVAAQIVQLKPFLDSQHIAAYIAVDGELDPTPILHCAQILHKKLYMPALPDKKHQGTAQILQFYSYVLGDDLVFNRHGIAEPIPNLKTLFAANELQLVIVPLVGFDAEGNRLGRGSGHYDYTFAFTQGQPKEKRPFLLGVAYEFQKVASMQASSWDIPLDMVVTEQNIYVTE